jgi:hypothetical protein
MRTNRGISWAAIRVRHGSAIWCATVPGSAQQSGTGGLTLCVDASWLQYHTGKVFQGPSSLGLGPPWELDRVPVADGFPPPSRRVRAEGVRAICCQGSPRDFVLVGASCFFGSCDFFVVL